MSNISTQNDSAIGFAINSATDNKLSFKYDITKLKRSLSLHTLTIFQKMRMSEKCQNNISDNPLTSRRTDGGNKHGMKYRNVGDSGNWSFLN